MAETEGAGPIRIIALRPEPPAVDELRAALPGWEVRAEKRWLGAIKAIRISRGGAQLVVRTLGLGETREALVSEIRRLQHDSVLEEVVAPQRVAAAQGVLEIDRGAGGEGDLEAVRAIAQVVHGLVSIDGRLEDAEGRLLARPRRPDEPKPEEAAAARTPEEAALVEAGSRRRARTLEKIAALGFPTPPEHFPFVGDGEPRQEADVVRRALGLHAVLLAAGGMPVAGAWEWLEREGLSDALTPAERAFLGGEDAGAEAPEPEAVQAQVEALWALAWALGQVPSLDFGKPCGDGLRALLPDLEKGEGADRFKAASHLRPREELLDAVDLAYCLTWGAAEANLGSGESQGEVPQHLLWERRRALEWLEGDDWDAPDFST